jgi:hypothetical protein
MERTVVKLKNPITLGSERIDELTFRPLKAKDLRRCKAKDGMPQILELAGYLAGQTTQVIDELEGEDVLSVLKVVNSFFVDSQETGSEESE